MNLSAFQETPFKIPSTDPNVNALLIYRISRMLNSIRHDQRITVVCIGTDRSTGDALGPLVGTTLSKQANNAFDVYGTLESPVHAMNLEETLTELHRNTYNPYIIGIDACLGQVSSVGSIQVGVGPVRPGAGVNKELPPVGDMHVTGIVNVGGFMEYFVLQNTRLSLVVKMADIIANSLLHAVSASLRTSMPAATQD